MAGKHRVLILGGGFGGLHAARALKRAPADITLVDHRNFHLFQPLLYQVATGSLSPGEIATPLRGILGRQKNTRVLLGDAVEIDPVAHRVSLRDGATLDYDSLVVATGSQSHYFGNDDWREWAPSLKSVEEATAIRHKILYAFEAAEREHDPALRTAWLTFVIVGAGATGVELAGALAEISRYTLRHDFRSIRPEEARILLMDGASRILPALPPDLAARAEQSLCHLGARVRTGVKVTAIDSEGVTILAANKQERIATRTVLWAGGVSPSAFGRVLAKRIGAQTDRSGRIPVNPDLTVPGYPSIYVVGDLALAFRPDGTPLPGVAQVAIQQGAYAAHAIGRRLDGAPPPRPFHYFDRGDIAVIGRASAVANLFGLHVWGYPAWLVWVFIHLMYLVEFRSRLMVFIQWGFQYLTFSHGARLITGEVATSAPKTRTADHA